MLRSLEPTPSNSPRSQPWHFTSSRGRHLDVERCVRARWRPGGTRRRSGSGGKHIFSNLFGLLWRMAAVHVGSCRQRSSQALQWQRLATRGRGGPVHASLLDFGDDDSFRRRRQRRRSCLISPDDAWLSCGTRSLRSRSYSSPASRRTRWPSAPTGYGAAYSSSATSSTSSSCWTCRAIPR